ncbi:MAG: 2-C-methyl-D-erythritol 2,4-cyclodiphosphate synthase, partial [Alphaproteobacteria bacterium]|nr:2-C-methyl-D-erythritol 2,4-cyclodiphosphate synthase [Alphaproteobacteria bacterium]
MKNAHSEASDRSDLPKQYLSLSGRSVVAYSIAAFMAHPAIAAIQMVIRAGDEVLYQNAITEFAAHKNFAKLLPPVVGGDERQKSVANGLAALARIAPDWVFIHDAARPGLDGAMISQLLAGCGDGHADGAILALPVADTVKRQDKDGFCAATVSRDGLWLAQTPQFFKYKAILAAHQKFHTALASDDAKLAEIAGLRIKILTGARRLTKITQIQDWQEISAIMDVQNMDKIMIPRTGQGFDVHQLGIAENGRKLMICGVEIPSKMTLLGHSDADVGLHALTDAILGALAAGDIGLHFPPSDPKWKNADSAQFLRHAAQLVTAQNGRITHVDVTLICESPRITSHREAMIARIAGILAIAPSRVSVKATTTEKLGFTGRGEGIAALA